MTTQTTYSERLAPPQPGTIAGDFEAETGIAETASPGIPFGRAVSQGTLSDQGVILGGSIAGFRGVSIKDSTLRGDLAVKDAYLPPNNVGILADGDIWLEPNAAVAANDPLWFNTVSGVFGKAAGTNMVGPLKGCRWKTSCGVGGRALASIEDYNRKDV